MKFLRTTPPVPPYLLVGADLITKPRIVPSERPHTRQVAELSRRIAAQAAEDDRLFAAVLRRLDERGQTPDYTDDPVEVFYSVADASDSAVRVAYYL